MHVFGRFAAFLVWGAVQHTRRILQNDVLYVIKDTLYLIKR